MIGIRAERAGPPRIVNVSAALTGVIPLARTSWAKRWITRLVVVLVVTAAGNEARVGGSPPVHHSWVVPVSATDERMVTAGRSCAGRRQVVRVGRNLRWGARWRLRLQRHGRNTHAHK
jgi:hypothetical protein